MTNNKIKLSNIKYHAYYYWNDSVNLSNQDFRNNAEDKKSSKIFFIADI